MWKQAPLNVLDSIGVIQAWGLSSCHQSLSDYFEGETPWVLLDFPDQVFAALKSDFPFLASELILLFSMPRAAEDHPLSG